jgi:hypothetical protein
MTCDVCIVGYMMYNEWYTMYDIWYMIFILYAIYIYNIHALCIVCSPRYDDDGGIDSALTGMLSVRLLRLEGMTNHKSHKSHPYCVLHLIPSWGEEKQKTKPKTDLADPEWNESFEFFVEDLSSQDIKLEFCSKQSHLLGVREMVLGGKTLKLSELTPSQPRRLVCHLDKEGRLIFLFIHLLLIYYEYDDDDDSYVCDDYEYVYVNNYYYDYDYDYDYNYVYDYDYDYDYYNDYNCRYGGS